MITKYYISFNNSDWSEFFPSNTPLIKFEREGQEIFKRPKVGLFHIAKSKNLTVYNQLASRFFDDTYFGTDIYYKININGVDKFKFIQPINKGKLNSQNGYYECTPDPNDLYRDILLQYERKWGMRGNSGTLFGHTDTFYYPKKDTGAFTNVSFSTFTDVDSEIDWTSDGSGVMTAYNPLPVATSSGDYITIGVQYFAGPLITAQLVNSGGTARSAAVSIDADGQYTLTQNADDTVRVQLKYLITSVASGSLRYKIWYPVLRMSGGMIKDILDKCINGTGAVSPYMGLSYTIVSTYLWNDALPTGSDTDTPNIDAYITANPTNDYVIEGAQQWNGLWLGKTDTLTTVKEEMTEVSLKDIMDILKVKLRAYWFIDSDGYFRIEHEKYFRDFTVQADLTSVTYANDRPEVDTKEYTFETGQLANQVIHKENNESSSGFVAYPMIFDPKETSEQVRIVHCAVSTDVENISSNADSASNEGLLLMYTVSMGAKTYVEIDDTTLFSGYGDIHPNAHLAWDYLTKYYFTYFADALKGYINYGLVETTFDHVIEFLKQKDIKFHMTSDLDWRKPFKTSLGTGWIVTAEYDLESGMYKIDLAYNPYSL